MNKFKELLFLSNIKRVGKGTINDKYLELVKNSENFNDLISNKVITSKYSKEKKGSGKLNLIFYEDNSYQDNKYKGFILSGLKALQSISIQSEEYLNNIDIIKAIFIQFIQFIEQFDNSFFSILIDFQRLDFDEGKQILINGKKSFLSFFSLLFKQMNYKKFENLIKKGCFKISENQLNFENFIEKFKYLIPSAILRTILAAVFSEISGFFSINDNISPPAQYSVTKYMNFLSSK